MTVALAPLARTEAATKRVVTVTHTVEVPFGETRFAPALMSASSEYVAPEGIRRHFEHLAWLYLAHQSGSLDVAASYAAIERMGVVFSEETSS